MKIYLISLGVGVLVGLIYGLLNVRSPAPPVVALIGLLGMLIGEQIVPVGTKLLAGSGIHVALRQSKCSSHIFGMLPGRQTDQVETSAPRSPDTLS